jgi:dCMP deaminase
MQRVNWDEHALLLAYSASLRSEDPYKKVGAAALDHKNRILGVSYNGLAPGKKVGSLFWRDRDARRPYMLHAETNLLARIDKDEAKMIAVTMQPCASCAQQIVAHQIQRVVYCEPYPLDSKGLDILRFYDVQVVQIPKEQIINHINQLK